MTIPSARTGNTIGSSRLNVMNFLNEVAQNYPSAISFASGRPAEQFFNLEAWINRLPLFVEYFATQNGLSLETARNLIGQYGRTNGIMCDLIARQLALDEGVSCKPAQIVVTAGCQEAMNLCVTRLCRHPDDIILSRSPAYIGITGIADLNGIPIAPFVVDDSTPPADALEQAIRNARYEGKRPRLLYLVPDFDNPTGTVLSRDARLQMIEVCARNGIVILEDNPYGMFRYNGKSVPTMFSLDTKACVVYLGTYSKTICPGLRVGFAVVPEGEMPGGQSGAGMLDALSQAKSFVTVNTSQIGQAIAGAILLSQACSLRDLIAPVIQHYRTNRNAMLDSLAFAFSAHKDMVSWNQPDGGFFLTLRLPFKFGREEAEICASEYGVLTMPLSFFALGEDGRNQVRLAFSNSEPEQIRTGIERLGRFVTARLHGRRE
ncbi:PLP-dependent aminotransferase family protein [Herbaspirillum sp. GCM10030257]|uniref:aminotransferase-like domain-containing protein n=1 Tax=Herbaspirillum sp. GCM10030257 TaxID=3273393 RepID=UPI003608A835